VLLLARLIWRALYGAAVRGAAPEANLPDVLHKPSAAGLWPSRIAQQLSAQLLCEGLMLFMRGGTRREACLSSA